MPAAHEYVSPQGRASLVDDYLRQITDIDRELYRAAFAGAFTEKGCELRVSQPPRHRVLKNLERYIDERNHLAGLVNQVAREKRVDFADMATYDKSQDEIRKILRNAPFRPEILVQTGGGTGTSW